MAFFSMGFAKTHLKKIWGWDSQQIGVSRTIYIAPLLILIVIIFAYIRTLFDSRPGEIAGALGSFLGGLVGAGGAVFAVYLAMSKQRSDEIEKVSEAVKVEVMTFSKYVILATEACEQIVKETVNTPPQEAMSIAKIFSFTPVIYPAVADRIGLLPRPQATVEFYMRIAEAIAILERIAEAKASLEMIEKPPTILSATYISAPPRYIDKKMATTVVQSLVTALRLAQVIIVNTKNNEDRGSLNSLLSLACQTQINSCIFSVKKSFPDLDLLGIPEI